MAMREMTPRQFVNWCNRVADGLEVLETQTVDRVMHDAYDMAVTLSSGPYDKAAQKSMYRKVGGTRRGPYSALAPAPPVAAEVINIYNDGHSPLLSESWDTTPPLKVQGALMASVYNTAPHALFMEGTPRMIERPLPARVIGELEPKSFDRWQRQVVSLLRR
jgi:hypothetical protein